MNTNIVSQYQFTLLRIRNRLNMSQSELARVLGFDECDGESLVEAMESGDIPINGTVIKLLDYLVPSISTTKTTHPEFLISHDLETLARDQTLPVTFIQYMRYPRFIAVVKQGLADKKEAMLSIQLDNTQYLIVTQYIDEPFIEKEKIEEILEQAAALYIEYSFIK